MLECNRTVLYSTWIRSSSALRTAGSVTASRWGYSAFRVPFNDSIHAWSVGVDGLPKCCAIAIRAMNRRGFMSLCQAQHRAKSAHSQ
jgi:hypothetical protein